MYRSLFVNSCSCSAEFNLKPACDCYFHSFPSWKHRAHCVMLRLQVPQNILHDPGDTAQEKISLLDPIFLLPLFHCCLLNPFSNYTMQTLGGYSLHFLWSTSLCFYFLYWVLNKRQSLNFITPERNWGSEICQKISVWHQSFPFYK